MCGGHLEPMMHCVAYGELTALSRLPLTSGESGGR